MLANRAVHIPNDNAMIHFRKIEQRGQNQHTLDKFMAKQARKATAEEEESTGSKTEKENNTKKIIIPSFYGRGLP